MDRNLSLDKKSKNSRAKAVQKIALQESKKALLKTPPTSSDESTYSADFVSSPGIRQQLRALLKTVKAVRSGDFSVRMPPNEEGIVAEIGEVLNDIIELNENMANEFFRVRNTVGVEGKMNERVNMGSVKGAGQQA